MLLKVRQESVADVRYEDFADDPRAVVEKLAGKIPQLEGVLTDATVSVKDYGESSIVNMDERQIETLSDEQISAISLSLSARPHVVESWVIQFDEYISSSLRSLYFRKICRGKGLE